MILHKGGSMGQFIIFLYLYSFSMGNGGLWGCELDIVSDIDGKSLVTISYLICSEGEYNIESSKRQMCEYVMYREFILYDNLNKKITDRYMHNKYQYCLDWIQCKPLLKDCCDWRVRVSQRDYERKYMK